jgi:DNA-directed RNA polymerase specialized sigma24 family protein
MDQEQARRRLSQGHAQALDLRNQGQSDEAIAETLGIPTHAVPSLLQIAEAKLVRLLNEGLAEPLPFSMRNEEETEGAD